MTTVAMANERLLRPAAPIPPPRRMRFFKLWRTVRENPIATVPQPCYEMPFVWLGRWWKPTLFLNDPAGIERVLLGNAANYRKSPQIQRRIQPALGDGLLTADGETWRAGRRIAAPLFSPKAVAALNDDMVAAAETMSARWHEECAQGPLDLSAQYQRLTYEIVSRTVFSGALDAERVLVHAEMARYFDSIGRVDLATMLNLPPWIPSWSQWRAGPGIGAFRAVIGKAVADRLAARARGKAFDDLLERLSFARDPQTGAAMPDDVVTDNVLTFLAAGHETTGNALSWISYLMTLFPETEAEMLAEFDRELGGGPAPPGSLERLPCTRAAIEETMRLYPPAPFMGRQAIEADEIAGERVPAGAEILIAPWVVHRHRLLWEEPDLFRPERFLPQRRATIARGAYIPFGLGPRICIGMGFAMQEILTVLSIVLPRYRFALPEGAEVVPRSRITLAPHGGMPMFVTPRA